MRLALCFLLLASASCARAVEPRGSPSRPPPVEPGSYEVISNTPLKAHLQAGGRTVDVHGQMSVYVHYSPKEALAGRIELRTLSVVFFGVPQEQISGKPFKPKDGSLSFTLPVTQEQRPRFVKYSRDSHVVDDDVAVAAHFTQLDELLPPVTQKGDPEAVGSQDALAPTTVPGRIRLHFALGGAPSELVQEVGKGKISGDADFKELTRNSVRIPGFTVSIPDPDSDVTAGASGQTRVARALCIRPIVLSAGAANDPTGLTLDDDVTQAKELWEKTGAVKLEVRDTVSFANDAFKVLETGQSPTAEVKPLRAEHTDPDCVEVYFVRDFIPTNFNFGATTSSPGTPDAQVIIAEHRAAGMLPDGTVLAHELGHVMGLGHPRFPNGLMKASAGTLMCDAKAGKTRPSKNSEKNLDLIQLNNALGSLQLVPLKLPDCLADCGTCP